MQPNKSLLFKKLLYGLILTWATTLTPLLAQTTKPNHWYIEPSIRYGRVMRLSPSSNFLWNVDIHSFEVRVGKQTDGSNEWEQWFRYPDYGIALRYTNFNHDMLGDKYAAYGFLNGYFVHRPKFSFFYQLGAGVCFWTKIYDFYTNHDNHFVGAYASAHIDMNLGITARMSPHTDFVLRTNFSHSSNGVLKLPNDGINGLSFSVGVRGRFSDKIDRIRTMDSLFVPKNSLYFTVSPAVKQSRHEFTTDREVDPYYCFATMLELGYLRQPSPKFRYGGGVNFFYNSEILTYLPEEERRPGKCFTQGIFGQFDIMYGRLVLHTGVGAYLFRYYDFYKPYYERIGFQVLLGPQRNHAIGASVKAHLARADYIEWSYSYSFYNWYDKKPRKVHVPKQKTTLSY